MYCSHCGEKIREGAKCCPRCGYPVQSAAVKNQKRDDRKFPAKVWAVIAAGVAVAAAAVIAGMVVLSGPSEDPGKDTYEDRESLLSGSEDISNDSEDNTDYDDEDRSGSSGENTVVGSSDKAAAEEMSNIADASVGDYVTFGTFEQDGDTLNGEEEITWIVLDEQGDNRLLISGLILEQMAYAEEYDTAWEDSAVRAWLNDDFYHDAFTEGEQSYICTTTVWNTREAPYWNVPNADNTEDRVFILSATELGYYWENYSERQAATSVYANKSGYMQGLAGKDYWLRCTCIGSQARTISTGEFIYKGKAIDSYRDSDNIGVRPALWVNVSGDTSQDTVIGENEDALHTQAGDTVFYGTADGKDLEWTVLSVENGEILMITSDILSEKRAFDEDGNIHWDASSLRTWLNSDFISECFTADEQSKLVTNTVVTEKCEDTQDRVYLLSKDEAESYFPSKDDRVLPSVWWLRTYYDNYDVRTVGKDGYVTKNSASRAEGVRPVICIRDEDMLMYNTAAKAD